MGAGVFGSWTARRLLESGKRVLLIEDEPNIIEAIGFILSRDGWMKRQKEVKDLATTRLREGVTRITQVPTAAERRPPQYAARSLTQLPLITRAAIATSRPTPSTSSDSNGDTPKTPFSR